MQNGKIVYPEALEARSEAVRLAELDRPLVQAIARRMKDGAPLPTLQDVEAQAHIGALTSSMLPAWKIALERSIIAPQERERLLTRQLSTIDRILREGCSASVRQTLADMAAEYRRSLTLGCAVA
jgi:hypothetical protein